MKSDTKKFLLAVIVVGIVILSGYMIKLYLENSTAGLLNQITDLEENINKNEWDRANGIVSKLSADWEKHENIWTIFINHHEIDNISITLENAIEYIKLKDKPDSLASIASLKRYISHIPEMERILLKNIF